MALGFQHAFGHAGTPSSPATPKWTEVHRVMFTNKVDDDIKVAGDGVYDTLDGVQLSVSGTAHATSWDLNPNGDGMEIVPSAAPVWEFMEISVDWATVYGGAPLDMSKRRVAVVLFEHSNMDIQGEWCHIGFRSGSDYSLYMVGVGGGPTQRGLIYSFGATNTHDFAYASEFVFAVERHGNMLFQRVDDGTDFPDDPDDLTLRTQDRQSYSGGVCMEDDGRPNVSYNFDDSDQLVFGAACCTNSAAYTLKIKGIVFLEQA